MSKDFKRFLRLLALYLIIAGVLYFWAQSRTRSGEEFAGLVQGIFFDFWVVFFPVVAIIFVSLETLIRYIAGRKNKTSQQHVKVQ
jgi:hypothetical protein